MGLSKEMGGNPLTSIGERKGTKNRGMERKTAEKTADCCRSLFDAAVSGGAAEPGAATPRAAATKSSERVSESWDDFLGGGRDAFR